MSSGLSLLVDNTTLHRLAFVLDRSAPGLSRAELANVLHLLECLVLADDLVVNGFESAGSHERSEEILDWLAHSNTPELVSISRHSDQDTQMAVAAGVAREMDERGLLLPDSRADGDLASIDVGLGRPTGVVEIAADFWHAAVRLRSSLSLVQEQAYDAVTAHRTDGLFVYGVAQHPDLVERVDFALRKTQALGDTEWRQAHVVFRALFNQRFAELHDRRTYAPPPVRAEVLRKVYSQPLGVLRSTLDKVAYEGLVDVNNTTFAEELLEHAPKPLPLLGLCFMLEANASSASSFADRLYAARDLAVPVRQQLSELEELARLDQSQYMRRLHADAAELARGARKRLGLDHTVGLDMVLDIGVTLHPDTGATTLGVKLDRKAFMRKLSRAVGLATGRAQRISVLSDGLIRTMRHGTVEQAVRAAIRDS